ncbi:hypothetical protein CWE12_06960 [Aliidiomarina sedimenti]|uniref:UmuC domain-containing protein n=1 Tax=Aliidiomarina sedimenti TaxID=1933879 RepID=A0ABY0C0Y7_9GAMM|nr:DNA polymerase Y family protein [Aliidiomarina sedimenti]RUO30970.1 hypothetical protein CWE12_06960 [Aliidiomarina sedimenti]
MVVPASIPPWAYIRCFQLYLEHIQRRYSDEQPVVVYEVTGLRVVQANQAALACGVEVAMPLSDAWLLCDNLQTEQYDEATERQLLADIALALYADFAEVAQDPEHCGLWLRLQGLQRLYQDPGQVKHRIQTHLTGAGYQLTFASNPRCAQLGLDDLQQPMADASQHCLVINTPLDEAVKVRLLHMGVDTLDKLLKVPTTALGKKFGAPVVRLVAELRGQQRLPLQWLQPADNFNHRVELAAEARSWAALRFSCKRLLQMLQRYLQTRQLALTRFLIVLTCRQGLHQQIPIQLAYPQTQADDFFALLQVAMEATKLRAPVMYVQLEAQHFEQLQATSYGFEPVTGEQTALPALLNRLQMKLGDARVYGYRRKPGWMPESQQEQAPAASAPGTTGNLQAADDWRPPWLVTPEVVDINEWQLHGQPQRLQSPWWQPRSEQRDYMLARDHHRRWGWLYFLAAEQRWYLHGWAS